MLQILIAVLVMAAVFCLWKLWPHYFKNITRTDLDCDLLEVVFIFVCFAAGVTFEIGKSFIEFFGKFFDNSHTVTSLTNIFLKWLYVDIILYYGYLRFKSLTPSGYKINQLVPDALQ